MSRRHFFVVGAQRSGTTHLYHLLASHPEIEMAAPVRPEPKFFVLDALYAKGLSHYDGFFRAKPGARVRGEKTVSYMESDKAAERIASAFPDAIIVFLLRNPVDRAVSHYWFSVDNGLETLPMEEAFRREEERETRGGWEDTLSMSPFAYLRRGRYLQDVPRWERRFGRERLVFLTYERLSAGPEPVRELCRRLGVDDGPVPSSASAHRPGREARAPLSPALQRSLVERFAEPTAALGERYGLDLSPWIESWKSRDLSFSS